MDDVAKSLEDSLAEVISIPFGDENGSVEPSVMAQQKIAAHPARPRQGLPMVMAALVAGLVGRLVLQVASERLDLVAVVMLDAYC